ncbi:MAG: hypothetical protein KJ002_06715 [Candidatus Dadabacteria bacterium]|nr:hypothetical protein [Candidatus Dadabacteria bacterium]
MKKLCTDCYFIGAEASKVRGSWGVILLIWLLFIVSAFMVFETGFVLPIVLFIMAMFFSLRRMTGQKKVCPSCEHESMIPLTSQKAQSLIKDNNLSVKDTPENPERLDLSLVGLLVAVLILLVVIVWMVI